MPHVEIPLTKGYVALIDESDAAIVSRLSWSATEAKNNSGDVVRVYATAWLKGEGRQVSMHRLVMGEPDCDVDHRDVARTLDNRRSNLRCATRTQNNANRRKQLNRGARSMSSAFKGVWWYANRWVARVRVKGKVIHAGRFKEKYDAALAYNLAAEEYFGEFARFNTPQHDDGAPPPAEAQPLS